MKRILSLILSLCLVLGLCACGGSKTGNAGSWQEQYDLGIRYLSEGNYEEAIIAFTAAIKIDPKQPDAYVKAAEAYKAAGDTEGAIAVLEQGVEAVGGDELQALLDELLGKKEFSPQDDSITVPMEFEVVDSWGVQLENIEIDFCGWSDGGGIMISATVSGEPVYYAFNMCDSSPGVPENIDFVPMTADEMERVQQWGEPNTMPSQEMCVFPNSLPYNIYRLWDSAGNPAGAGSILVHRSEEAEAWIDAHPDIYVNYYE